MKWTLLLLAPAVGGLLLAPAAGGEKKTYETFGTIHRHDPRFDQLVPKDAKLQRLAGGFKWTEGPVWVKTGGYLLFSDIPNNVVNKWKEGEGVTKFIHPSGYTGKEPRLGLTKTDEPGSNGLRIGPDGLLVLCQHGNRRVVRLDLPLKADTKPVIGAENVRTTTLAEKYMGKRLNSPNDCVFAANGDLLFTDPPYGLPKHAADPARELDFQGVYRITGPRDAVLLTKEMSRPNGIGLSPDEKTLYVANSDPAKAVWMAFPVKADGALGAGKVFFDSTPWVKQGKPGLPDGLKVDVRGNIWATGPGGVHLFAPDGTLLGSIETGVPTANVAFGGDDGSVLYVAANHDIARIQTGTKGLGYK